MPAGPPPTTAMRLPVSAFGSTGSSSSPSCSASLVWSAMKRCSWQIVMGSSTSWRRHGPSHGPRAHAPEHAGEREVLAQFAHAVLVVALRDVVQELRDLDVRRAGVAAGRRAERVVVAQQQLQVQVPHGADLLGVGAHHHAVGDGGGAARHHLARALDLDDAHAAGGRGREPRLVAQRRDADADAASRLEDGLAAVAGDLLPVDGDEHLVRADLRLGDVLDRRRHGTSYAS